MEVKNNNRINGRKYNDEFSKCAETGGRIGTLFTQTRERIGTIFKCWEKKKLTNMQRD